VVKGGVVKEEKGRRWREVEEGRGEKKDRRREREEGRTYRSLKDNFPEQK
jgi:hypothetical protein